MGMKEFTSAARRHEDDEQEEPIAFKVNDREFRSKRPTPGQLAIFMDSVVGKRDGDEAAGVSVVDGVFSFLRGVLLDDGYDVMRRMIQMGEIDIIDLAGGDEDGQEGIIDWIAEQSADGRPTGPSTDSSKSPEKGGRRSTGRSPGKGSTLSPSPSADSSTP